MLRHHCTSITPKYFFAQNNSLSLFRTFSNRNGLCKMTQIKDYCYNFSKVTTYKPKNVLCFQLQQDLLKKCRKMLLQ